MKEKYYTIYKITNLINGMIYIGHHTTFNLNDSYMGSGREIKNAINEYGKENFKREFLFIFDNKDDMIDKEVELVTDEFRKRDDTYNLALGGGCFGMLGVKLSKETCEKMSASRKGKKRIFSESHCNALSAANKGRKVHPDVVEKVASKLRGRKRGPMSEAQKTQISLTKKNNPVKFTEEQLERKRQSMSGKMWITNLELMQTKMVKNNQIDSFLASGWVKGRKTKFHTDEQQNNFKYSSLGKKNSEITRMRKKIAVKKQWNLRKMQIINSIVNSLIIHKSV